MGHCVGGYCEGVASGDSRIFSLRDKEGRSHVTVETRPETVTRMKDGGRTEIELDPTQPERIIQIKGKQNRAPDAKYLPYVQDFVKGGKWGEVGDLGNTGLFRSRKTGAYMTEQELKDSGEWMGHGY